jgi:replicative DNA helicase
MTRGVTVIGGPSSSGKSVMACQIAANLARMGHKVVYASYEMSWDVVQLRCASSWSCTAHARSHGLEPFSWSDVVSGRAKRSRPAYRGRTQQELERMMVENPDPIVRTLTAWDEGPSKNLAVVCGGESVIELCDFMRLLNQEQADTTLIVDYLQIMPSGEKDERGEYEHVTNNINALQSYAFDEHGGRVIAISSTKKLTSQELKEGPTMDWFRGSGYVGYASEQAVMIVPDREKDDDGRLELSRNEDGSINEKLHIVKNKSGASDVSMSVKLYGGHNLFI